MRTSFKSLKIFFLVLLMTAVGAGIALAQPITTNVLCTSTETCSPVIPTAVAATLRRPATPVLGKTNVGIFIMHTNSSYINFAACTALAQRGYTTLCANGPFTGNQFGYYGYEQHALAIAGGLNYLRNTVTGPGITKALIFGHSMGAPLMAFYENVAENGSGVCAGPEKLVPCVDTNLHNLPRADGVILFDAHLGDALATFTYIDPAVINNTLGARDASVDLFDPVNGYNTATDGASYISSFKKRYLAAQAIRNQDLVSQALALLQARRASTGNPNDLGDSIPFTVVGANAARLWQPDVSLVNCTRNPHVLLSHDGTRPVQKVCSVRLPSGQREEGLTNASTLDLNVHTYLGAHALRTIDRYTQTIDDIAGIDYESSDTATVSNVRGIRVPLLIVANGAHYFLAPDEKLFENAVSADKTYVIEEGAVHGGGPCTACATALGLPANFFGDTAARTYDFMAEWLAARY